MTLTYGRPAQETTEIPVEIAILIVKKACQLAEKLENEAIDQMTRDVRRALQRGTDPAVIVSQMGL
jgi:ribosomal protein S15P/S13E